MKDINNNFTDEAAKGIDGKFNACMYRGECRSNKAELTRLQSELAETRAENERLKDALTPKQPREGIYPWSVPLEPTAQHANFWIEGGRKETRKGHAIMCVEQAVNSWKNAAYHYAEKNHDLAAKVAEHGARLLEQQSAWFQREADVYASEHGFDDLGSVSFGRGAHAEYKADHHNYMLEQAERLATEAKRIRTELVSSTSTPQIYPTGWDAEFLAKRLRRVANLVDVRIPDSFSYEQVAEYAGTVLGQVAAKLTTKPAIKYVPVSDETDRYDNHPNDKEPRDEQLKQQFKQMGDDVGQGLSPYWKWAFASGWNASKLFSSAKVAELEEKLRVATGVKACADNSAGAELFVANIRISELTKQVNVSREKLAEGIEHIDAIACDPDGNVCLLGANEFRADKFNLQEGIDSVREALAKLQGAE